MQRGGGCGGAVSGGFVLFPPRMHPQGAVQLRSCGGPPPARVQRKGTRADAEAPRRWAVPASWGEGTRRVASSPPAWHGALSVREQGSAVAAEVQWLQSHAV